MFGLTFQQWRSDIGLLADWIGRVVAAFLLASAFAFFLHEHASNQALIATLGLSGIGALVLGRVLKFILTR